MSNVMQSVLLDLARIQGDAGQLGTDTGIAPAAPIDDTEADAGTGFADSLSMALHAVDEQARAANEQTAAVDSGHSDDLVGAMLSSQQANLSFSMLMQVRNKVAGAFDELIKLQI